MFMATNKKKNSSKKAKTGSRPSKAKAHPKRAKLKAQVNFEVPHYPQTEEFTSSAACTMMVLKYLNKNFKLTKDQEYGIWQEAVNGSVWHGSKYGIAYALAKRGARVRILSNTKDEGYDRKLAVYENVNLDTLTASFNEIRDKASSMKIEEEHSNNITINSIKKALSANQLPIVLIDANVINPYMESSPHWVVVTGYDKDAFYINDPYSDSTMTLDAEVFKSALGYDNADKNFHIIATDLRKRK